MALMNAPIRSAKLHASRLLSTAAMTRDEFWKLIALVDHEKLGAGDEYGAIENLIAKLATLPEAVIFAFQDHLAEVLYVIDSRAHADNAGESSNSDDAFLYARCYVVAGGREHYERVVTHPDAMPKTLDEWCEALLTVAPEAWAKQVKCDPEEWEHASNVSYESGSNKAMWVEP